MLQLLHGSLDACTMLYSSSHSPQGIRALVELPSEYIEPFKICRYGTMTVPCLRLSRPVPNFLIPHMLHFA